MPASAFTLESTAFENGETIPGKFAFNGFGCTGENVSPALSWSNAPEGTKSFALLVHDPDAPTGGAGFWHWSVINISASVSALEEGVVSDGAMQIRNDYGVAAWGGPCPPVGDAAHRYNFTLHALSVEKLEPPEGATASLVGFLVNANTIDKAELQGLYSR